MPLQTMDFTVTTNNPSNVFMNKYKFEPKALAWCAISAKGNFNFFSSYHGCVHFKMFSKNFVNKHHKHKQHIDRSIKTTYHFLFQKVDANTWWKAFRRNCNKLKRMNVWQSNEIILVHKKEVSFDLLDFLKFNVNSCVS